jgi:hypothetical protein
MVLKKLQFSVCPNPTCGRSFENLIVIHDQSKKPAERFYACPHCFFKLDPTVTCSLKRIEKVIEEQEPNQVTLSEEEIGTNCPKYFGYLADYIHKSIIPRECLDCAKMSDCMKNNGRKK